MNSHTPIPAGVTAALVKADDDAPALLVTGAGTVSIREGTIFRGSAFNIDTPVLMLDGDLEAGTDYVVVVANDVMSIKPFGGLPLDETVLGGFHCAPGGNATARAGGDSVPAINPHSLWDLNFRPACPDPRGMVLVEKPGGRFWCDIYLTGVSHLEFGTSKFAAVIADGDDRPQNPDGRPYKKFDYATAQAVMDHHGKGLLSLDEFFAAAYGVTERSSVKSDPGITGLDAARTSKWGVMQATGNMWVWGHDGDPDTPRAALLGGSWWHDVYAGSRCAYVDYWADLSSGDIGARGRSDHLQPV